MFPVGFFVTVWYKGIKIRICFIIIIIIIINTIVLNSLIFEAGYLSLMASISIDTECITFWYRT